MRTRHRDDDVVRLVSETSTSTSTSTSQWSPAQVIAFVVGAVSLALGVIAVARTGLHFDLLPDPRTDVLGFSQTQFFGLCEVGFGVLLVIAAMTTATPGRALMTMLGVVAIAFGILVVADAWPATMARWIGEQDNGWLSLAAGVIVLFAAAVLPTFDGSHTVVRDRRDRSVPHVHA
jgi:hypothetical protein